MGGSNHINFVWFSLGALTVEELVNRLVDRLLLKDYRHDLKQGFAQQWRAALGNASGIRIMLP